MNRMGKLKLAVELVHERRVGICANRFPQPVKNHNRAAFRVFRAAGGVKRLIVSPESKLVSDSRAETHIQPTSHLVLGIAENPVPIFRLQPFGLKNLDGFIHALWLVSDGTDSE